MHLTQLETTVLVVRDLCFPSANFMGLSKTQFALYTLLCPKRLELEHKEKIKLAGDHRKSLTTAFTSPVQPCSASFIPDICIYLQIPQNSKLFSYSACGFYFLAAAFGSILRPRPWEVKSADWMNTHPFIVSGVQQMGNMPCVIHSTTTHAWVVTFNVAGNKNRKSWQFSSQPLSRPLWLNPNTSSFSFVFVSKF